MKKYQSQIIIEKLLKDGEISRNYALKNYISRLGAWINILVSEGWKFDSHKSKDGDVIYHGRYVKSKYGTDFVYTLVSAPKRFRKNA